MKLNIFQAATVFSSAKYMLSKIDNRDMSIDHIVVVPDKFSLLTEKLILDIFPQGSLFNVRVKSLSSLSRELMQKLCFGGGEVISSGESLLLTQQAIENVKKDFVTFRKNNINFCYEISKLISQFKSSCISAQDLEDKKGAASGKYHDLALIYAEYQRLLEGKLDANERMRLLKEQLAQSDILANTKIYFAHFDAFTKEGFEFVEVLFQKAAEISVAVAAPLSIGNDYIYEKDMQRKLEKVAQNYGQTLNIFSAETLLKEKQRAIAKGLFSYEKVEEENEGYFNVYGSPSVANEVESVAKLIRYHAFKGRRYRDFQIAVGNLAKYQGQIENIFARYDIPCYVDNAIAADKTILGNFVLSFLEVAGGGYAKESLVDFFANVLVEDKQMIDLCQRLEIDGKARYKKYAQSLCCFAEEFEKLDNAKTSEGFGAVIKDLYSKVEERYQEVLEKLLLEKQQKEYNINVQAKEILDESLALIEKYENGECSCGEYLKKLKLLLSFKQVSTVPTYVDSVMIGDATTSGFEEKPVLIVMGGEELPIVAGDNGLLCDEELKTEQVGKEIEPTIRMINRRNRFKLFGLLTLAQEDLFVFYQLASEEGKKNELSAYIKSLCGIFSQPPLNAKNVFFATNPDSAAWAMLVSGIKEEEKDFSYLDRSNEIKNAESLMLGEGRVRVTQLENFFVCPFKHFANYGLKLKEKMIAFDQRDLGTLCHKMAEIFVKKCVMDGSYQTTDIKEFVEKHIMWVIESEGVKEKIETLPEKDSLVGFLKKQMISLLKDIAFECDKSSFKPRFTEVKFEKPMLDGQYKLIGKADRIDQFGDYLRVVDYKTGKTGNLVKQLYYGEKLQLFLYQKIAAEKYGKKEGGALYFNAKFNYSKNDEESNFILKGLIDKEEELIFATDSDIETCGRSTLTQIYTDSKGYKGSTLSPFKLKTLCDYAYKAAENAAKEIAEGFASPKPTAEGCEWCPYGALCGYEKTKGVRANKDDVEF